MNKQQQIEEMSGTIQSYSDIKQSYYDGEWHSVGVYNGLARTLYSKDFRIVNKDSVVLSREEYEILTKDIEHPTDKVLKKLVVGKNILTEQVIEKTREETAEKDFNAIIQALEERKDRVKAFYGVNESVGVDIAIRTIKELAKQFGVEIKEL